MKAAVYRGSGDLVVEDVPLPEIAAGEMLVKVDVCGVCGTDVKKVKRDLLPPPRIFGHEISGTVVRKGAAVLAFREGDRVALHHHVPCGACYYCRLSLHAQCDVYKRNGTTAGFEPAGGGYAEYVRALDWIVARGAIRVPDGIAPEEAAFVEPVNTCLKAVRKAGVRRGQSVLVVGQGPIGLLLLQLVRREGAAALASDTLPDRLEKGRALGAVEAWDARACDVAREARAVTEGRGVDVAILAAPGSLAFQQALDAVRPGGCVMVFAATAPGETAELDLGRLCLAEKEIRTSYSASVAVQDEAATAVFSREVRVAELVTHRLPLAEAARAFELASSARPGVLKVMLDMRLSS
jgi:L-iditol 2-dehydrogenase